MLDSKFSTQHNADQEDDHDIMPNSEYKDKKELKIASRRHKSKKTKV